MIKMSLYCEIVFVDWYPFHVIKWPRQSNNIIKENWTCQSTSVLWFRTFISFSTFVKRKNRNGWVGLFLVHGQARLISDTQKFKGFFFFLEFLNLLLCCVIILFCYFSSLSQFMHNILVVFFLPKMHFIYSELKYNNYYCLLWFMFSAKGNLPDQIAGVSKDRWRKAWKPEPCYNFYPRRSSSNHWHEPGNL